MAIRPGQRSLTTANSLQANALGEFAGTAYSPSVISKLDENPMAKLSVVDSEINRKT